MDQYDTWPKFFIEGSRSFTTSIASNYSNATIDSAEIDFSGSSYGEVFLITFTAPAASLVMSLLSFESVSHATILQFVLLMLCTIWSDQLTLIFTSTCVIAFSILFLSILDSRRVSLLKLNERTRKKYIGKTFNMHNFLETRLFYTGQIPFLTDYRGCLFLLTAIAILAVDFKIFPKRFAKTSSYGWSIMDCGVGSFIVTHGICSSQARGNYRNSAKNSIMSAVPLLLLGFMRLTALNLVNYHESITEYGVHWNFFFTLAITKMISSLLLLVFFPYLKSGYIALCVVIVHQWLLSSFGVTDLVLSKDRDNLFLKNKEGICSLLGFIAIYLAGVELGKAFWKPRRYCRKGCITAASTRKIGQRRREIDQYMTMCKMRDWLRLFTYLLTTGFVGLVTMLILHNCVQPTSRRMANITYCAWIVGATSLQIAAHLCEHLMLATFRYFKVNKDVFKANTTISLNTLLLFKAINYNGLFYFLLTNILTGLVNLSMDTDKASSLEAYFILAFYMYGSSLIIILMMKFSLKFKFW